MKIFKSFKYRIYPNKSQEVLINKTFGCTRFLYNKMLEERISFYNENKNNKDILFNHKYKTEKQYKSEFEWLSEVDSFALVQSRMNLELSYKNFFNSLKGKRKGKLIGFPKFKSKKNNRFKYRTQECRNNIRVDFDNKLIKLPKLGFIKYRDNRLFEGVIKYVTVEKTPTNKYFVSILVESDNEVIIHKISEKSKVIGLDYDSKNLFTDNQGNISGYPKFYRKYEKLLAKEQRKLAKKQFNSNRYIKQKIKVAKVHEKIVNSRKDFQQKLSTEIIRNYDIIGIETLNMQSISQCLNLAKSTLDNSWSTFINMLEYKTKWHGKHLIFADKHYASSKMCNVCGYKNIELKLSDRQWICPICHTEHHRDINAAINLMNNAINKILSTVGTTGIQAHGDFF
jgi:putative transposase